MSKTAQFAFGCMGLIVIISLCGVASVLLLMATSIVIGLQSPTVVIGSGSAVQDNGCLPAGVTFVENGAVYEFTGERDGDNCVSRPIGDNGPVRLEFTAQQLDAEFGADNWQPFEDRRDGVAVRNLPTDYFIAGEVVCSVDKGEKYGSNDTVKGNGGATAWLCGTLNETDWNERLEDWRDGKYDVRSSTPQTVYSTPSTTDQGSTQYICTVAGLYGLVPNITNVQVTDSTNGAAMVTVSASTKIPAGWTVDSMGAKYFGDKGDYVPDEGTDTWWAPACGKPLK